MTAHIAPWKKEAVSKMATHIAGSKVVGIINVRGVPAPAFQTMRADLRGNVQITMLKNSLMKRAFEEAGKNLKGIDELAGSVDGQCAVVTSELNPFRLFKQLDRTKTKMPARGGEIAPDDIEIKAGDTPFKPGPVVGDLQKAGLPAAIEHGKVVIKRDKLLVKKGDEISREVALVLTKLEIFPITVGLDLRVAYEEGMVFANDVLAVDDAEYLAKVQLAVTSMLNLSVFAAFPTETSTMPLLAKAHTNALNLAVNANIVNRETVKIMLAKANAQMMSLASRAPDALVDDPKGKPSDAPAQSSKEDDAETGKSDEKDDKDSKDKEKVSKEEAAAGPGALSG